MASPPPSPTVLETLPAFSIGAELELLLSGKNLSRESATAIMEAIVGGRMSATAMAALMVALRAKGESAGEIAAFAAVMRARARKVQAPPDTLDTCGTGGDKSGTFNISTATAFVAAGMGIPVAKHGNRSASSLSGSADALKWLGVNLEAAPECVERCILQAGIGFMFAPLHHPGLAHAAPVRKELGVRTFFNLLGPLANPAGASLQLIGVSEPRLCGLFAEVLKVLGSRSAMVVCGASPTGRGCLDEVSTFGPTTIARLRDGVTSAEILDPASLGVSPPPAESLRAGSVEASVAIVREVLAGKRGPPRDIVVLNAAAAALVAAKAGAWPEGIRLAEESIDSGRARQALENLVRLSNAPPAQPPPSPAPARGRTALRKKGATQIRAKR